MWISEKDKSYLVFGVKACKAAKLALTTKYFNIENEAYKNGYAIILQDDGASYITLNIGLYCFTLRKPCFSLYMGYNVQFYFNTG